MKSVDALRELVKRDGLILEGEELDKYLDAIEDEGMAICAGAHSDGAALAFELAKLAYKGDDERYQFCRRVEVAANDRDDVTLFGVDYTPLPVDADGEAIHVGERVQLIGNDPSTVSHMSLAGDGWRVYVKYDGDLGTGSGEPSRIRHHYAPTVEDVLREFADMVCNSGHQWGLDAADTIAEYAAKLRLAGEDE